MTAVSSRLMAPLFSDERTRNGSSGMRLLRMLSPKIPNKNPTHTATSATITKMGPQRDRERKESETNRDSARYHILHYVHIRVDFVVTCAMHVSIHPYIHRCRHRCRQRPGHRHRHTSTHTHTCRYTCAYIHIHTHTYTSIHTYIHTYIPYHTIPYHTIPYRAVPYRAVPHHTIPYHTSMPCMHAYIYIYTSTSTSSCT